ncbi:glycosyltransferase family 2 protein [Mycolicibacterium sp.]|uniref:glycosyltransferase family 2 protein n=1 Tax=Mycolicibacterium sp. TaxID=2320850 RepID=UPI001A19142C|nr:glycosyltransferase family 2 protein [Mycolicibacterium sp.]MBJ7337653.1 glycosyltransferase family 2 protein [Mycolicibacterium sp.]
MTDLQINDSESLSETGYLAAVTVPDGSEYVVPRVTGLRAAVAAPTVSLVIPVRNEARNIAWVLEQIADDVDEIILVDGDSTDATLITACSYRPDIRVVAQEGIGKGSALRTGFFASTCDLIVMMDADGSMSPQEIRHYVHFLNNGYDFVKGSRFMGGGGSLDITPFRRMGNRFLLGVFNALYGGELTDLCYGFCAFHRRYLDHLDLTATGFEIEAEMTVRAMQAGLRIAEVPSLEMPRRAGKSNLRAIRDGWRVLDTVVAGRRRESRPPAIPAEIVCTVTDVGTGADVAVSVPAGRPMTVNGEN